MNTPRHVSIMEGIVKNIKKSMNTFLATALIIYGITVGVVAIYGCYWLAKTVSYSFFYEDMVQRTVVQMVKPEALKQY